MCSYGPALWVAAKSRAPSRETSPPPAITASRQRTPRARKNGASRQNVVRPTDTPHDRQKHRVCVPRKQSRVGTGQNGTAVNDHEIEDAPELFEHLARCALGQRGVRRVVATFRPSATTSCRRTIVAAPPSSTVRRGTRRRSRAHAAGRTPSRVGVAAGRSPPARCVAQPASSRGRFVRPVPLALLVLSRW